MPFIFESIADGLQLGGQCLECIKEDLQMSHLDHILVASYFSAESRVTNSGVYYGTSYWLKDTELLQFAIALKLFPSLSLLWFFNFHVEDIHVHNMQEKCENAALFLSQ